MTDLLAFLPGRRYRRLAEQLAARFVLHEIVYHGYTPVQILGLAEGPDRHPRYRVRYYNDFFGGEWVAEEDLRRLAERR